MRAKAEKTAGGYRLNAASTGSPTRRSPTWRWCGPSSTARSGASWSSAGTPGFTTTVIEGKLSLRASITGDIGLQDVEVGEGRPAPGVKGLRGPFSCLNKARYGISWGAMGAAEACFHAARTYTSERILFGRPLSSRQLVQKKLADMQTEIALGLEGALALGRLLDQGAWVPEAISMMKRNNCGKALAIAREAATCTAGRGSPASTTSCATP